ncbi:hypothetical protein QBC43DRAFT_335180 [Cladorrhinum sp. PSN259]|nr:hypothetical protein QBC43DRAFT_335180 [Cladorrhinum sp. PSN259]
MSAALAALKKIHTAISSVWPGNRNDKRGKYSTVATVDTFVTTSYLEPGPLSRSTETGGCRLPRLDSIASVWDTSRPDCRRWQKVGVFAENKLAADIARPFGQSTGRGFSFTRFRIHRGYQTLTMQQQDVYAPCIGSNHVAITLYEIGHIITDADPICRHLRWAEEYPFFITNLANFGLDTSSPMGKVDTCIHKRLQYYAINIIPDAARPDGRLLVFTIWKCLGNGNEIHVSTYWNAHLTAGPPKRWYGLGHAYYTFEGPGRNAPNTYEIDINEIYKSVASVRESCREPLPDYTAVAEPVWEVWYKVWCA